MAVADLPPRLLITLQDVCPFYELEGDSSRGLRDEFHIAMDQWQNRPSTLVESAEDEESFNHVPFRKAGTMRVRFKMAGAMMPRVIDTAEAVAE